jgi:hypothetical protein
MKGCVMAGILTLMDLRDRCVVDEDTGCWVHQPKTCATSGIYVANAPDGPRTMSVGATVYWLKKSRRIPKGKAYFSTCFVARCCNPAHRKLGTRQDQLLALGFTHSLATRARMAQTKRSASILTEADAQTIRQSDEDLKTLSRQYGVTPSHISRIKRGQSWKPLHGYKSSIFNGALG